MLAYRLYKLIYVKGEPLRIYKLFHNNHLVDYEYLMKLFPDYANAVHEDFREAFVTYSYYVVDNDYYHTEEGYYVAGESAEPQHIFIKYSELQEMTSKILSWK